ncbi:hypothetical protein F3Y22_tig00110017pilonHSYRG00184 [Hibiscus syriacus]|uniref:Uncharacterized protein n=1 Tax=Hibiscus syriacus TaxID=106335 RepID=A0A6A3BS44_HIBSY|nr:hypothetical protein F3Y22_tig00110017pilonHSYRG00184 [Hibiscus syriacus]
MSGGGSGVDGGGSKLPRPTLNDATMYVKEVKAAFRDQEDKYGRFIKVLMDFKAQRARQLDLWLNTFLPKGYEIPLERRSMLREPTKEDAVVYLKQVKEEFLDEKDKYIMLLRALKNFSDQRINVLDVIAQVKELLRGHTNLINGFNTFLPEEYELASTRLWMRLERQRLIPSIDRIRS